MTLVFATHNANKLNEIRTILGSSFHILSLQDIHCHEEIPEEHNTLLENALQKATYVKKKYGYDCFADDTGLEVRVLNHMPGAYSARYAGIGKSDEDNINKLLQVMKGVKHRKARFRTVIALLLNNKQYFFEGRIEGNILTERHGTGGFGYDPIFCPDGYNISFAEMNIEEKNQISHRGKAVGELTAFLRSL